MLPRSGQRKQPVQTEADEDRMASRLQLDLERDNISRKNKAADKQGSINVFRGVSFDEWLRMIIQVWDIAVATYGNANATYSIVLCSRNAINLTWLMKSCGMCSYPTPTRLQSDRTPFALPSSVRTIIVGGLAAI